MPPGTPDEWLFDDWQLIAIALLTYRSHNSLSYKSSELVTPSI